MFPGDAAFKKAASFFCCMSKLIEQGSEAWRVAAAEGTGKCRERRRIGKLIAGIIGVIVVVTKAEIGAAGMLGPGRG